MKNYIYYGCIFFMIFLLGGFDVSLPDCKNRVSCRWCKGHTTRKEDMLVFVQCKDMLALGLCPEGWR